VSWSSGTSVLFSLACGRLIPLGRQAGSRALAVDLSLLLCFEVAQSSLLFLAPLPLRLGFPLERPGRKQASSADVS
jgi:hypothetical protein